MHLRLLNREELAFRRCFVAWCTQFQITHVFLEAVLVLRPSNFFKTCESLFGVAPRARRLRGTASPSAFDASSFPRLDPLRRRMNRRPLLESVFFTAAASFFSRAPHSLDARRPGEDGSTPFWRKAGTSLFTYKSRAWRMRYAQAQFQLVKAPASHYLPSLLIMTYAGATTVAPPGRAARERGRPALCANVLDEFVRGSSSPARPHVGRAGPWAPRPSGSERPSSRPSCSPCTVTPTSFLKITPRVVSLSPLSS